MSGQDGGRNNNENEIDEILYISLQPRQLK